VICRITLLCADVKTPAERFDLTGRVALVTGGSRGLGRAMVLGFARAGADVVITSRKLEACQNVAREVETATGRRAFPYACHVGHWDEIEGLVDAADAHFGRIDVLVNNAGMSPVYDSLSDVSEKLFDKVLDVNLKGPFRLSVLVGTKMAAADGGSIINISSAGSLHPQPGFAPYAAAKAGLNTLTEAFARAFGPKVRVNCIVPGAFRTDATKEWDWASFEQVAQSYPLKRAGEPDDIVGAALYFASDASSFTTGAMLYVDGGAH
jgi:NAD(P)-dependent dehydrogenase (short-subunit alcohol dehydrogenase family)